MLSYAFSAMKPDKNDDIAAEDFDNIHNLFAAILSKGISQQLKRGLYREYLNHTEDLSVLRGKINLRETIKHKIAKRQIISCEYDVLTENNLLNQILKTTVFLLIQHPDVAVEYKDELKKEMLFFSGINIIDPFAINWVSLRFQRNNQTYRLLISLCQLVLQGMLLSTETGDYKLASFVDEQRMCRLYERFILEYFRKEHLGLSVKASQIPWALDDGVGTMLPAMQSDITLSCGNKMLIIDAKYYSHTTQMQYDVHTIHSHNLYQIFTYVKNAEANYRDKPHKVFGMLLYARTDEEIQPDNDYMMSGNHIAVKTLDLNCKFTDIKEQLNLIATRFLDDGTNSGK